MLRNIIIGLSIVALPTFASAQSSTQADAGAFNSLTLEGSTSSSVGVGNNTAPCQQVNGASFLGMGVSNSRTLDWCLSTEMAQTLVSVSKMRGEQRRVAVFTLCSVSREYREILVGLGYCEIRKSGD